MKRATYYLHTLNGLPAVYIKGQGICFASFYGPPNRLARSLKQIRQEQRESGQRDMEMGQTGEFKYGYIRVSP